MKYIIALDQGTTSSRALLINEVGKLIDVKQKEFKQIFPKQGWVEHDPIEIWNSVKNCINEVDKQFSISQLSSIGITNQRETTLAWSKSSGEPLFNALVSVSYTHLTLPTKA